jgi:hypothetical protein
MNYFDENSVAEYFIEQQVRKKNFFLYNRRKAFEFFNSTSEILILNGSPKGATTLLPKAFTFLEYSSIENQNSISLMSPSIINYQLCRGIAQCNIANE